LIDMTDTPGDIESRYPEWTFSGEALNHHYLVPAVLKALRELGPRRVLDIGCGNGWLSAQVAKAGITVTGIDFTPSGIERAKASFPDLELLVHDAGEPLPDALRGQFDVVLSAEMIEHLFLPRTLFARAREALVPEGHVVITTPYHGYLKNLALAITGKFDHHWAVSSDFGHINFFSERTLAELARQCGFEPIAWDRAGRIGPLAATMVMTGLQVDLPQDAPGSLATSG
jgi:2-polyprenyl-3-methyl-5-hydroxy-6-metoxy-1,4-benzoquinol methylase